MEIINNKPKSVSNVIDKEIHISETKGDNIDSQYIATYLDEFSKDFFSGKNAPKSYKEKKPERFKVKIQIYGQ